MTRPVATTGLLVPGALFLLLPLAIGLAGEGDEAGALGFRVVTSAEFLRHDAAQPFDRVESICGPRQGRLREQPDSDSTGVCHLVPVPCRERMALLAVIQGVRHFQERAVGGTSRSLRAKPPVSGWSAKYFSTVPASGSEARSVLSPPIATWTRSPRDSINPWMA